MEKSLKYSLLGADVTTLNAEMPVNPVRVTVFHPELAKAVAVLIAKLEELAVASA
jgi:hypothetical protein